MTESTDIIPVSCKHIIGRSPERIELPSGMTIAEMLQVAGLQPYGLSVFIDDRHIERWQYSVVRPMPGEQVFIFLVPHGGDNNKLLRSVAMIGVMVLSIYVPGMSAFAGLGTFGQAALGVAIGLTGSLLVNALIPPSTPNAPQLATAEVFTQYSLTGTRNSFLPFQSIPKTLGTDRVYPPYAAKPYTHIVANTQYIYMLFCLGRGPLNATSLKLGNTLLSTYEGVEINYGTGAFPPAYFNTSTISQTEERDLLDVNETEGNFHAGDTATERTTDGDVQRIGIELYSPALYFVRTNGTMDLVEVTIEVKYKVNGTETWIDANLGRNDDHDENCVLNGNKVLLYGYSGTASRYGFHFNVPVKETYDVSIRRTYLRAWIDEDAGDDIYSDQLRDDIYLTAVKSILFETFTAPDDMEFISVRMEASEQLNGVPDDFNAIVAAKHPVYTARYPTNYEFYGTANGWTATNGILTINNKYINISYDPDNFVREDNGLILLDDNLKYIAVADTPYSMELTGLSIDGTTGTTVEIRMRQLEYGTPLVNKLYWTTSGHGFSESYYTEVTVTAVGSFETVSLDMTSPTAGGADWSTSTITGLKLYFATIDYGENYDIDYIRVKDSSANDWTYKTTANPAWIYTDLLTGTSNHRAKSLTKMDTSTLVTWAAACETNGYTYNGTVSGRTLREMMRVVCAAGRAAWTIKPDGTYSVIYDGEQTDVYQVFSPRNSWGFVGHKPFVKLPHAIRIPFRDSTNDYELSERIVYRDDYDEDSATLFESIEFDGLNHPTQIFKFGRYNFAQAQLRPESYELFVDFEYLVAERGQRIRIAHDIPMWGTAWARIKTVTIDGTTVTLTLDDYVTFELGITYAILIRVVSGNPISVQVTNPGASTIKTVICTLAAESSALIANGDLVLFGVNDAHYQDLIIKQVYPQGDLAARLELVDYNTDIYDDDTVYGSIPEYDTNITIPKNWEGLPPPTPRIDSVVSDDTVLIVQENGVIISQIVISYGLAVMTAAAPAIKVECQFRVYDTGYVWRNAPDTSINDRTVNITGIRDGIIYEIRIRTITAHGIPSAWVSTTHEVIGKIGPPPQVLGFSANIIDNQIELRWTESTAKDISEYHIKYGGLEDTWDTATSLGYTDSTSYRTPARWSGPRIFFIKAVDTSGNESETATTDDMTINLGTVVGISTTVVDNNVLFYWTNQPGTLPIDYVEIRKGSVFATATVIGKKSGTFTTAFETLAGQYKYWFVPIDSAGNYGVADSTTATVDEPPNYVLNQFLDNDFVDGTGTNVFVASDGTAIAPANITETWTEHFTTNSYDTFDDFISAGINYYIQPVPTTAEYYEEFDLEAIVSSSMVTMDLDVLDYDGGPTITEYLAEKELVGGSYSEGTDNPVWFSNFQYLRDRFTIASDGSTFCRMNRHTLRLDAKLKEDGGMATITNANDGVAVTFAKTFADITSISVSAAGTTASIAIYDFTDSPNPTGFTAYLFNTSGTKITGTVSWTAKGY